MTSPSTPWRHLAVAQFGAGRADDAWKTLAMMVDQFPASKALPRTRLRLGEAALAAHQPDRAAEQFRLVPSQGDKEIEPALRLRALAGLGRALAELNKPGEAAQTFAAFLAMAPGDPIAPRSPWRRPARSKPPTKPATPSRPTSAMSRNDSPRPMRDSDLSWPEPG